MTLSPSQSQNTWLGLGMMSGTSCDGLDMALCMFSSDTHFELLAFESIAYTGAFRQKLLNAIHCNGAELLKLEAAFTEFVAEGVQLFLRNQKYQPQYIAAHGHTVFHNPQSGITFQMLNGALLCQRTGLTVVCDFRRQDVAEGGQGAPLVPLGDRLLFSNYHACINLGGFANCSFPQNEASPAYDITVANLLLDALARREGLPYDEGGHIAQSGVVQPELLDAMNALPYFYVNAPKSLGREWFEAEVWPLFVARSIPTRDLLATAVAHIAFQVGEALQDVPTSGKVLFTGGGVLNSFLMKQIEQSLACEVSIPDPEMAAAKEALIFALLGKLRLEGKPNVIAALTGSKRAVSAGAVYRYL